MPTGMLSMRGKRRRRSQLPAFCLVFSRAFTALVAGRAASMRRSDLAGGREGAPRRRGARLPACRRLDNKHVDGRGISDRAYGMG